MEKVARFFSLKISEHGGLKKISNFKFQISNFKNPHTWLLASILSLAAYLRLNRISDYMTFLGDEGRDVLVVRGILGGDLTLLGPRASAGDFFTGPIYYYFMAPFLWLFNYDPVGPAVMIALLGIITVFLVYVIGKRIFGNTAGLIAAFLYTISPVVIAYSRSSWNPNPMPFFSLVMALVLYKAMKLQKLSLYVVSGILFGLMLQLHYIELFFGIVIFFFIVLGNYFFHRSKVVKKSLKQSLAFFGGCIVGFSPFLAFEIKHGFPNFKTILGFILDQESTGETIQRPFFETVGNVFFRLFGRLITRFPPPEQISTKETVEASLWFWGTVMLGIAAMFVIFRIKDSIWKLFIGLWFGIGILLFGLYQKSIYDYYFEFLFPLPFLLVGSLLSKTRQSVIALSFVWYIVSVIALYHLDIPYIRENILYLFLPIPFLVLFHLRDWKNKRVFLLSLFSSSVFVGLVMINLYGYPFQYEPNRQKDQVRMIAEFVLEKTEGKPFNFALLTLGNSDHGYRYFFDLHDRNPVTIKNEAVDPERTSITDQLLIVCEDPNCQPLGHSLWEVAGFGRAEIEDVWEVSVVKVYKLRHYQEIDNRYVIN